VLWSGGADRGLDGGMRLRGFSRRATLFLDLSRGRSALLSVSEPVLGAMLAGRTIPPVRVSLLGLLAALAGYLCVYSLNDLLDLQADREDFRLTGVDPREWKPQILHMDVIALRHPVAAGVLPLWAAATWVCVLGAIGLTAAYLLRPICAWLFVACALLEVLYCGLRRRTWLKAVPASSMVALGGLAGWFAVGRVAWGALAFFFLLFGWEMFGRNLSNDLADVSHDRRVGITTLASTYGTATAVKVIAGGAVLMPLVGVAQPGSWTPRLLLALSALTTMTIPAALLGDEGGSEPAAQRYFNRATFFPPLGALCLIVLALVHAAV
jgi:4-hydroxybenzoate polyprenyltransferase